MSAENNKFQIEMNGETIELTDTIFESGKRLSEVLTIAVANAEFSTFKQNLKEKKYKEVYTSLVFSAINDLCKTDNIATLDAGNIVVRARVVKDDDVYKEQNGIHFEGDKLCGYDWYNSKEPAIGLACEGRANSKYSSYFYCSDEGATAASEIKANIGEFISIASFRIKRKLNLVKLESKDLFEAKSKLECFYSLIAKEFSIPVSNSSEYWLTQFISDEFRKYGVDGICYKSHFTNNSNYVIFNCSMDTIEFVTSKILLLHSQRLNFIDFSDLKTLSTTPIPDLSEDEIKREKNYIYGMIESAKCETIYLDNREEESNGET